MPPGLVKILTPSFRIESLLNPLIFLYVLTAAIAVPKNDLGLSNALPLPIEPNIDSSPSSTPPSPSSNPVPPPATPNGDETVS